MFSHFKESNPTQKDIQQLLSIDIVDPNYHGISLIFHPLPLDSETTSVERIIETNWDEKQLQQSICK